MIGKFGLYGAIAVTIVVWIRISIEIGVGIADTSQPVTVVMQYLKVFILAVTVLVIAIPEGLPLAVTLSLA